MRQLQYAEDVVKKGFTGFQWQNQLNKNFADERRKSAQEQIDFIFTKANNCRLDYNPVFPTDRRKLPVSNTDVSVPEEIKAAVVTIVPVSEQSLTKSQPPVKSAQDLTIPPIKTLLTQDDTLNAVLIGLGVFVFLKIIS
jgi:hypothetical protein